MYTSESFSLLVDNNNSHLTLEDFFFLLNDDTQWTFIMKDGKQWKDDIWV